MTDSLLIFTFSPIQSFIGEARRAADLYTGSQILVELAKAAGNAIKEHAENKSLIYPAKLSDDVPNKLVAIVPFDKSEQIAKDAKIEMLRRWKEIAVNARNNFKFQRDTDVLFDQIWQTQIENNDYLWEIYWSIALLPDKNQYKDVYKQADAALNATKLTRAFIQPSIQKSKEEIAIGEHGFKDTLSGKRQALHSKNKDGREYWQAAHASGKFVPAKLRPAERLDSIGLVKRFRDLEAETKIELKPFYGFPSTSSIASGDFLEKARSQLNSYKEALENLGARVNGFTTIRDDPDFRYDGDLFYRETLTPKRLKDDHRVQYPNGDQCKEKDLPEVHMALDELYKTIGTKPSPYYAIIKLDGDSMGSHISKCQTEKDHAEFSKKLSEFAANVKELGGDPKYHACVIYNGGDDVLAMAPLSTAIAFAKEMADQFKTIMGAWGATASAGIVITHHLSPLSNALREVQKAEEKAKEIDKAKNAVCVTVLRRSGETLQMVSKWDQMDKFPQFVKHFEEKELSSKLPYDIAQASYALSKTNRMSNEEVKQLEMMSEAELRRLVKRHSAPKVSDNEKQKRATELFEWAKTMPHEIKELADWLSLIRFVSQGGKA